MIEILEIKEYTVGWRDNDGELYVYPRCQFPADLKVNDKYEYSAGQFHKL